MITGKIDVTKIDKARLFVGKKGKYLDVVLIETPNSEFGDYMIVQGVSKEEREKGIKGAILGNAKAFKSRRTETAAATPAPTEAPKPEEPDDDVPF